MRRNLKSFWRRCFDHTAKLTTYIPITGKFFEKNTSSTDAHVGNGRNRDLIHIKRIIQERYSDILNSDQSL